MSARSRLREESDIIGTESTDRIIGATAHDNAGDKIGKVGALYVDDTTEQPNFVTVSTGLFGMSDSFVPLQGASMDGEDLRVAYTNDQVKDAPRVDAEGHLSPSEESRVYEHYQLDGGTRGTDTGDARTAGVTDDARAAGQGREDAETLTAREERLNVGTRTKEAGRARLRKYTTTEQETVEVPVTTERLVVEREEEIGLREERPVVEQETVERERVRVGNEKVTDTETVGDELRTEHIDVEEDAARDRGDRDGRTDRR